MQQYSAVVRRVLIGAVLTMAFPLIAQANPGVWVNAGLEGGELHNIAVSPAMPERIYVSGGSGLFRSDNEGLAWQNVSDGLPYRHVSRVAVDPSDADIVYVSVVSRLYKSVDAGATWFEPAPGYDPAWGAILSFDINPADPLELTVSAGSGGLQRSADGGATWSRVDDDLFQYIRNHVILPDDRDTILAAAVAHGETDYKLYRSTNNGTSWTEVPTLPGDVGLWQMKLTAGTGGQVLAATHSGNVYRSEDGGQTFAVVFPSLAVQFRAVAIDPTDSDVWYLGGINGLVVTRDGGTTHEIISDQMGPIHAGGYNAGVTDLALKPGSTDTLYVASPAAGFFHSADEGQSWSRRNSGLHSTYIRSLAINPHHPGIVYAGFGDASISVADNLWVSFDAGASWAVSADGLDSGGVRALALDPNTADTPLTTALYAAGWGVPIYDIALPYRPYSSGVFKSGSGGADWVASGNGIPIPGEPWVADWYPLMRALALDPASGLGGDGPLQTVYVAGNGHISYSETGVPAVHAARIYKSTDAGGSWAPADSGLPVPPYDDVNDGYFVVQVIPLVIDPANPQTLYAGTYLSSSPGHQDVAIPQVENGLFKSVDGGDSWFLSSNGLPRFDDADPSTSHWNVMALAIASSDPDILYAAAGHPFDLRQAIIHRSTDGGVSWVERNNGIPDDIDIRWLLVDPDNPDIAYAAGSGSPENPGAIYRTADGGENWVSYSIGLPAESALTLAIDGSGDNTVLYAGGRGGVFRLEQVPDDDVDGVPDSVEQGAPSGGDGNADGVPDFLQPEVASLHTVSGAARGISDYVTVELMESPGGECQRLMNVHALGENAFPVDADFEYPYGLLRFEIPACAGAIVRMTFHDKAGEGFGDEWDFRVYAPDVPGDISTIRWQSFGEMAQAVDSAWVLDIGDGMLGDLRPQNGRILFQGGPARLNEGGLFSDRFESP